MSGVGSVLGITEEAPSSPVVVKTGLWDEESQVLSSSFQDKSEKAAAVGMFECGSVWVQVSSHSIDGAINAQRLTASARLYTQTCMTAKPVSFVLGHAASRSSELLMVAFQISDVVTASRGRGSGQMVPNRVPASGKQSRGLSGQAKCPPLHSSCVWDVGRSPHTHTLSSPSPSSPLALLG